MSAILPDLDGENFSGPVQHAHQRLLQSSRPLPGSVFTLRYETGQREADFITAPEDIVARTANWKPPVTGRWTHPHGSAQPSSISQAQLSTHTCPTHDKSSSNAIRDNREVLPVVMCNGNETICCGCMEISGDL